MRKFSTRRQRIVGVVLLCLSFILAVGLTTYLGSGRERVVADDVGGDDAIAQVLSAKSELDLGAPPEDLKTLTVLLLGYGGAGHQGGGLTDVLQVVHVDFDKNQVALISIPRDLWITLPGRSPSKINNAYVAGGEELAKQMATAVTGLPVQYAIAVDFVGFKRIVGEELDGLEVNVPETLDDPWYPIKGKEQEPCGYTPEEIADLTATYSGFELEKQFECRYEHIHFDAGVNQMEGGDALAYVRSRHGSAAGDFSRSQRQHALLLAIRDKLFSMDFLAAIPDFFEALVKHVQTDISLEIVEYAAPALQLAKDYEVKTVVLSTDNVFVSSKSAGGAYIIVPREGADTWGGVHAHVQQELL